MTAEESGGIRAWLDAHGLSQHTQAFEAQEIDLEALPELTDDDLKEMGLAIGPRRKLLKAIRESGTDAPVVQPREAERRQITVMFCDLVGATALSEKLDPEDLRGLMQRYQQAAGAVIERYGGHVAQYLGDGLMTYFGWPQAHEDDPERAARASLDIVEAVNAMDLQVRIGIATGPVVVGETGGGDASVPKLAVGETPNLAARLQGLAGADQIVVGASTRRLLGGTFELVDMGEQALKGIVEPVLAHRIEGLAATEGRFEAQHQHLTPLVGREAEMAMVTARWEQAKAGEGQVIVLGGEPGIGKSRITQALRERLADEPHMRLRYQCSPYHTNSALHPIMEQIERAAGFQRDDAPDNKLDKLERLFPDGAGRALLASLLSLPVERYPALAMSPQKQKEETLRTLAAQVTTLAAEQPVLLIFEDAHWIDPTSQELLDLVVPLVAAHHVLAVISHRPEYQPPWLGQGHVAPLALTRLGRADAAAMVARVSDTPLPDEVLDQIVAKTDGVPLFVEELTKTVIEGGAETANAIPETLQDSLMARLDRLSPVKEVAQIGACFGRQFSHELLAAVSPLGDNELGEALQQLLNSELIHRSGDHYAFKHALVQDAAYNSLLKSRRQQLHTKIAEALIENSPAIAETEPEVLAHHYTQADLTVEAIPHWLAAGQNAIARLALVEAISHCSSALELVLAEPPSKPSDRMEIAARAALGTAHMALRGWQAIEVRDTLAPAWELMRTTPTDVSASSLGWLLCMQACTTAQIDESLRWVQEIFDARSWSSDPDLEIVGHMSGIVCEFWHPDFAAVIAHGDRIHDLYDADRHAHLVTVTNHDPLSIAGIYVSFALWMLGYPDQARKVAGEKDLHADRVGHPFDRAFVRATGAAAYAYLKDAEKIIEAHNICRRISDDNGIPFLRDVVSHIFMCTAHTISENFEEALNSADIILNGWNLSGLRLAVPMFHCQRSEALILRGCATEAVLLLRQAVDLIETRNDRAHEPEVYRLLGVALSQTQEPGAEDALTKAITLAQSQNAKGWELRAATSLARLRQSQGKAQEAHDLLAPVYGWFTEGFDTPDLKDAKALLAELA